MENVFPNCVYLLSTLNSKYSYWNEIWFERIITKDPDFFPKLGPWTNVCATFETGKWKKQRQFHQDRSWWVWYNPVSRSCWFHIWFERDREQGICYSWPNAESSSTFRDVEDIVWEFAETKTKIWTSYFKLGGTDLKKIWRRFLSILFLWLWFKLTLFPRMNHNLKW